MPTLLSKFENDGSTMTPLRGEEPTGPLRNGQDGLPINNTFELGTYQDYVVNIPDVAGRSTDLTAFSANNN